MLVYCIISASVFLWNFLHIVHFLWTDGCRRFWLEDFNVLHLWGRLSGYVLCVRAKSCLHFNSLKPSVTKPSLLSVREAACLLRADRIAQPDRTDRRPSLLTTKEDMESPSVKPSRFIMPSSFSLLRFICWGVHVIPSTTLPIPWPPELLLLGCLRELAVPSTVCAA